MRCDLRVVVDGDWNDDIPSAKSIFETEERMNRTVSSTLGTIEWFYMVL